MEKQERALIFETTAPVARTRAVAPHLSLRHAPRQAWQFLGSVRVALVLILVLSALTLVGTLLIQVPSDIANDRTEYRWWLDNVGREKVGFFATPLALLGLFDVYHSVWFLGAGLLLMLSIVVCSLKRWKEVRTAVFPRRVPVSDAFYQGGVNRAHFTTSAQAGHAAGEALVRVLRGRGYHVRSETRNGVLYVAADRHRYSRLATYLHHWSIVLLIFGFLIGSYMGFRATSFAVPEGSERELGYGTDLSLRLESFADEYWIEGPPKDYRSQVTILENGQPVTTGLIRVNHPLSYKGVRFYQSYYGPAAVMEVRDASGQVLYADGVALGWTSGKEPYKRPTGVFSVPDTGYTAYIVAPAKGYSDPLISAGQMRVEVYNTGATAPIASAQLVQGQPKQLMGMAFTFVRERQFSGFQVSRDPGNALIWVASTLFTLGLAIIFYWPHRQVWARVAQTAEGGVSVHLRASSTRSFAVASDFMALSDEVERAVARPPKAS